MQRKQIVSIFLLIFLISFLSAQCDKNQIDINSASLSELDELQGIGPSKAQAIIDTRPFKTVDDLIDVSGIGPTTLENIKSQGLACVSSEETDSTLEEISEEISDESSESSMPKEEISFEPKNAVPGETTTQKEPEIISLSPKSIKTTENTEKSDKKNYSIYGLLGFGLLITLLFLSNKNKKYKNEFRE